uniref:Putative secreted protein n=1 Tax=Anopheles darlingi TaxID=43151 RepID=A0A2M4D965_ANODA
MFRNRTTILLLLLPAPEGPACIVERGRFVVRLLPFLVPSVQGGVQERKINTEEARPLDCHPARFGSWVVLVKNSFTYCDSII